MLAATIPVSSEETLPERAIFIEINDKSMSNPNEPISFEPGDKAMIDLDAKPTPADFVLALVPEEHSALFRLYREVGRAEDGSMIVDLVPLNPNFRTVRISDTSPGQIIGVCRRIHRIVDLSAAARAIRLGSLSCRSRDKAAHLYRRKRGRHRSAPFTSGFGTVGGRSPARRRVRRPVSGSHAVRYRPVSGARSRPDWDTIYSVTVRPEKLW